MYGMKDVNKQNRWQVILQTTQFQKLTSVGKNRQSEGIAGCV